MFTSYAFAPSVGGLETASLLLAREFARAGHEVRVVTETPGADVEEETRGIPVIRSPGFLDLMDMGRWSEILFQNNLSMRLARAWFLAPRPWIVAHQTWIRRPGERLSAVHLAKGMALRCATSVAISRAMADRLPGCRHVIPNPYEAEVFRKLPEVSRDREMVFVGRLVSDKGADLLLDALAIMVRQGSAARLTIVGDGPERAALETRARAAGIEERIEFCGVKRQGALAEELNRHRLIVVPSRWAEPFGIVALEGIACGCVAVGSDVGGLPEAIGPCGVTFPGGDAVALARLLGDLLADPARCRALRDRAAQHLVRFRPETVAGRYLELMRDLARGERRR